MRGKREGGGRRHWAWRRRRLARRRSPATWLRNQRLGDVKESPRCSRSGAKRDRIPMNDLAVRGGGGEMRPHLPQILALCLTGHAGRANACREGPMRLGQDHAMSRYCSIGVDEVRVRRERARQARGIVSPGEAQRVHQQVRYPGTNTPGEGCSLCVGQRLEMLRQRKGRPVLDQPFDLRQGAVAPPRQHFRGRISERCRPCDRSRQRAWAEHKCRVRRGSLKAR